MNVLVSQLPRSVLCTEAGNSLCAPAQCPLAETCPGGQCLGTLGELWMHLEHRTHEL